MPQVVFEMWNVKLLDMFKTVKVFYKFFSGQKPLFQFFVAVVYYTFLQELLHSNVTAQKLFGRVAVL